MLFSPAALRCFVAPQQAPSLFWREMQSTDWRSKRVESKMWNTSPVRTEQMSFNFLCRGSSLATNIQLCLWLGTYWEAFDHFGHLLAHQLLDLFSTQWWGGVSVSPWTVAEKEQEMDRDVSPSADCNWFPLFKAKAATLLLLPYISNCYHIMFRCAILLVECKIDVLVWN